MKFLDLFAGIGGFRLGMEQAGHECVGYVEWDKYARKSYEAMHDTKGEWTAHDITAVTDNDIRLLGGKGIDVICGGFPCQAFSVAGKRGGFADTRGTLFFEIARIAKQIKPRILLLENVKGLLSHEEGRTFGTILNTLDELGYDCEWQVLNSKNFGVPQNRERVFIVGHLRGASRREVFPIGRTDTATDIPIEIIAHRKGYRRNTQVFSPNGITETLDTGTGGGRGHYTAIPVLTPDRAEKRQNGRRFKEDGDPSFTLTAQDKHGVMINYGELKSVNGDVATCLDANYAKGLDNHGQRTGVLIKEATKKGYAEALPGDSVNYSVPTSKTRRGRVGKGIANTLDTGCQQGVVVDVREQLETDVKRIMKKTRNEEIGITFKENGDIRPHRLDARKSGVGELNINHEGNASHTVTSTHMPKVYGETTNYRIRKLSPKECFRLQGFPDDKFHLAESVNSNSQLYKQAGNSVTVNVIHEIAKRL